MNGALGEGLRLVRHSLAGTLEFRGRARRLEVAWFWLVATIASAAVRSATAALLAFPDAAIAREVADVAVWLPFFALFVRRLHDQGRSGWWVLMLPPLVAFGVYARMRVIFHAFDPRWPEPGQWGLVLLPAAILVLVFAVIPGEDGTNAHGPDPRLEPDPLARA